MSDVQAPMSAALWINEAEAAALLTLPEAIDVLADSYRQHAAGSASGMPRTHARSGEAILHAVGGILDQHRLVGTKTWIYTPGGAAPLLILFSLADGSVRAVIEAFGLGQVRTAATSGLGTRVLARADARVLALFGTGKQAYEQARAITYVRAIEEVRVFGRDRSRRQALATRLAEQLEATIRDFGDPKEAMAGADVATTITRAHEPFLTGSMIPSGVHINAVGAIVPARRELDHSAVRRCDAIVVDSVEQARNDSGELRAGLDNWDHVTALGDVIDTPVHALRDGNDITLFKALGVGVSDVALGAEILRRATTSRVGQPLATSDMTHATHKR